MSGSHHRLSTLALLLLLFCSCIKRPTDTSTLTCMDQLGWNDTSDTHPKNADFTKLIEDLTATGLPGISLMIEDEHGLWHKSSGYADIDHKTPMQICHLSKIASVSKLFTAVLIYRLRDQGKLQLDDSVKWYVHKKYIKRIKNLEHSTIRDLLSHSSGIYDIVFDQQFILNTFNNLDKEKSYESLLQMAYDKPADFAYGSKRSYNQTLNHVLLAMIINKVTGNDHAVMLHKEIFSPLNMNESYIRPSDNLPWNQVAKGYYDYRSEGLLQDLTPLYTGDGKGFTGIYTTVNDLRKFIAALYKHKTLISPNSYAAMVEIPSLDNTLACAGGCRAMRIKVNGNDYTWYGHPGGEVNYAAGAFYCPEKNATITFTVNYGVAFTNMGKYTDAYFAFRDKLFEVVSQ